MRTLALAVLTFAAVALADPPSPEQMAKLQHDIQAEQDKVDKQYSGRELSPDERKQQIKDRGAAQDAVLEKNGVDRKDYARAGAKMSKEDRATVANESAKLDQKDKAAASGSAKGAQKDVVVEKGGSGKTDEEEAADADKAMGYGKGSSKGSKSKKK